MILLGWLLRWADAQNCILILNWLKNDHFSIGKRTLQIWNFFNLLFVSCFATLFNVSIYSDTIHSDEEKSFKEEKTDIYFKYNFSRCQSKILSSVFFSIYKKLLLIDVSKFVFQLDIGIHFLFVVNCSWIYIKCNR